MDLRKKRKKKEKEKGTKIKCVQGIKKRNTPKYSRIKNCKSLRGIPSRRNIGETTNGQPFYLAYANGSGPMLSYILEYWF